VLDFDNNNYLNVHLVNVKLNVHNKHNVYLNINNKYNNS
jgi:hypothetical protein